MNSCVSLNPYFSLFCLQWSFEPDFVENVVYYVNTTSQEKYISYSWSLKSQDHKQGSWALRNMKILDLIIRAESSKNIR